MLEESMEQQAAPAASADDDWLLAHEVAKMAVPPVTPSLVRFWAKSGRLPYLRLPSGVRLFRRVDVLHHLVDRQRIGCSAGRRR